MTIVYRYYLILFLLGLLSPMCLSQGDSLSVDHSLELRTFDQDELENYRNKSKYNYDQDPKYEDNFFKRAWLAFVNWITKDRGFKGPDLNIEDRSFSWVKYMFYASLIGAGLWILFLIYQSNYSKLFLKDEDTPAQIELEDLNEESTTETILELIQKAKENGDYRLTVRLLYLKSLKVLKENELIRWRKGKTNYDYLNELKNADVKKTFRELTYIYEYIWYGEFNINSKAEFSEIDALFDKFENQVNGNG